MSQTPRKKKAANPELEARLQTLRAEIDEIHAALGLPDAAAAAAQTAEDIGEDVLKEARRALKQIHKQASTLETALGVQTRDNPLQTLLLAFGAGMIASLLLQRR